MDDTTPNIDMDYRSEEENFEEVQVAVVEDEIKPDLEVIEEPKAPSRREPEEEYFMLAVLALKFQHLSLIHI